MTTDKPSHIRDVGVHPHNWHQVGTDAASFSYEECVDCGTRRVKPGAGPARQDWLDGAPWDEEEAAKAKAEADAAAEGADGDQAGDDSRPTDGAVRAMNKAELLEYAGVLGISVDEGATNDELIEDILAQR